MSFLYFGLPSNFSNFSDEEQNNFISKARKKVTTNNTVNKKVRSGVFSDDDVEGDEKEDEKKSSVTPSPERGETVKREPTNSTSICSEQAVQFSEGSHNSCEGQEVSKEQGRPDHIETSVVADSVSSECLCQSNSVEEVAKGIVDLVIRNACSVLDSQCSTLQDDRKKSEKEAEHGLETSHVNKPENSLQKLDENLEYDYEFSLDTLSDGKVCSLKSYINGTYCLLIA
jgi:hypothetical protein